MNTFLWTYLSVQQAREFYYGSQYSRPEQNISRANIKSFNTLYKPITFLHDLLHIKTYWVQKWHTSKDESPNELKILL